MSNLPPLSALHTFIEVGKSGSMKRAAELLCVSPGAVSQQIKALEDRMRVRLFERAHRELHLSDAGRSLFEQLSRAFEEIHHAWENTHAPTSRITKLTISTTASFANSWLAPRIGGFTKQWPNIEINIETSPRLIDLRRDFVDVAIRHGLGDYPQHAVTKLWTPAMVPVCSPGLLGSGPAVLEPVDCLQYPLLQDADRADWALWLRAQGIENASARRGSSFCDDALLIKAAVAGQGIALVSDVHASAEIANGRLVRLLRTPWPTNFAYYLVTNEDRSEEWKIAAFRKWMLEQVAMAENAEDARTDTPNASMSENDSELSSIASTPSVI
ncbi:LysR family transcriptional regulator [Paraburkholderia sp. UYCP14C]|uniref:LysR substrate-binding domain-containing protein n=1 Tax=Paraburkholderia sp. UYCP14C TaxID=2511130 RepID=UPI00102124FD|nr:LysR substrate-binding domain-containing protein [Paraburkholderia sp. UYCP14C]RZF24147.1 LysR family transcriptional regulator [Paraburkholderia sp. UYCP14C]